MPAPREGALRPATVTAAPMPVLLEVAAAPLELAYLSAGERARHDALPVAARRREWLVGRRCLKALMARLELGDDTAGVRFPHPSLSLSHSGGAAVAAGTDDPDVAGVGVDVETRATVPRAAARFFLSPVEQVGLSDADLVRLWTVKEALFKAHLGNEGTGLLDYVVDEPTAWSGTAQGPGGRRMRYQTTAAGRSLVTVAVTERSR